MTAIKVSWVKTDKNTWTATVDGKKLTVYRERFQRSWTVEPRFGHVPGTSKPRHYTSCTVVYAIVQIGNEYHRLNRPDGIYTVDDAKSAAIRYATTGGGIATVSTLED